MNTSQTRRYRRIPISLALAAALLSAAAGPLTADDECKVRYRWVSSTGQNQSDDTEIDEGATKTLNKEGMLKVENLRDNPIRIYMKIGAAPEINRDINGNQDDPPGGTNYGPYHKLVKVKCLENAPAGPASPEALIQGLKSVNQPPLAILSAGVSAFPNVGGSEWAELFKAAGYLASVTAQALSTVLDPGADDLGEWIHDAGWGAVEAAKAMKNYYSASAEDIASLLEAQGVAAGEVLQALVAAFGSLGLETAAESLLAAGYATTHAFSALVAILSSSAESAGEAMTAAGFPGSEVIMQMTTSGLQVVAAIVVVLENVPSTSVTVTRLMLRSAKQALGFSREVALEALEEADRWSESQIQQILDFIYGALPPPVSAPPATTGGSGKASPGSKAAGLELTKIRHQQGGKQDYTPRSALPLQQERVNRLELFGAGLRVVTSIAGFPSGSKVRIVNKSPTRMMIEVRLQNARPGQRGKAHLHVGNVRAASFNWVVANDKRK